MSLFTLTCWFMTVSYLIHQMEVATSTQLQTGSMKKGHQVNVKKLFTSYIDQKRNMSRQTHSVCFPSQ